MTGIRSERPVEISHSPVVICGLVQHVSPSDEPIRGVAPFRANPGHALLRLGITGIQSKER